MPRLAKKQARTQMKRETELTRLWKRKAVWRAGLSNNLTMLTLPGWGLVETDNSTLEAVRRVALSMVDELGVKQKGMMSSSCLV